MGKNPENRLTEVNFAVYFQEKCNKTEKKVVNILLVRKIVVPLHSLSENAVAVEFAVREFGRPKCRCA